MRFATSRSSCFFAYIYLTTVIASPLKLRAELEPILTTIRNTPELSTFYSLFSGTGGDSGIPGPALEERFNNPDNALIYTVFAPTNDAFANASAAALEALAAPMSYSLLYILLINHIAPGALSPADLLNSVHAVGGFDISFTDEGTAITNPGVSNIEEPDQDSPNLIKGQNGQPVQLPASNGVVYQIDHVIDGLYTYFGSDVYDEGEGGLPEITTQPGTMLDVLSSTPELSILYDMWEDLDPDFLTRLSLHGGEDSKTVYLAPGNAAFEGTPEEALSKAREPSNAAFTAFLLGLGLGELDVVGNEGGIVKSSQSGFQISIDRGVANNARVERRICAENGCVWIVRRWLDPLYGIF